MNDSVHEFTSDVLAMLRERFTSPNFCSEDALFAPPNHGDDSITANQDSLHGLAEQCRNPVEDSATYCSSNSASKNSLFYKSAEKGGFTSIPPFSEQYTIHSDYSQTMSEVSNSVSNISSSPSTPFLIDNSDESSASSFADNFIKKEFQVRPGISSSFSLPVQYSAISGSCSGEFEVKCEPSTETSRGRSHVLPPCRVCGDKASGFHYGANTCEACKGFFRRTLKKGVVEYHCSGNKDCRIQKGKRNNCPDCRYKRCVAIGMSRQAIKTGRYTHEKRTKDIVEVKQLSGDPDADRTSKGSHSNLDGRQGRSLNSDSAELLEAIYTAHKTLFPLWHKVLSSGDLEETMKAYAKQYHHQKSLLGTRRLSQEERDVVFYKTGVDLDGRATASSLADHLQLAMTLFVKFAKAIPGFTDLQLNDQALLLKASLLEIWMIGAHRFLNKELQVTSGPQGFSYHLDELAMVMNRDFVVRLFSTAHQLQQLNLTPQEVAILKCIVLMFSDRTDLQEPEQVDKIQARLVQCLKELMHNNRRFYRTISALTNLRDLTELHKTVSRSLLDDWPAIHRHPLLVEMLSV